MSRYNHKHTLTYKEIAWRVLFILVCTAILVLFIPRSGVNSLEYTLGEPWDRSPLIAQESFPVFKSDQMLDKEKDSLKRYYEPYFHIDQEICNEQEKNLETSLKSIPSETLPAHYIPYAKKKLKQIYQQGIISAADYDRLQEEEIQQVRIFSQNESSAHAVNKIYTEKTAYEFLTHVEDTTKYNRQILIKCDFSRFLRPNLTYDAQKSEQQQQEVDAMLVPFMGQVQVGQKIVDRGQIVDEYTFNVLNSLERHMAGHSRSSSEVLLQIGGHTCYALIMVLLLFGYLQQFRSDYLDNKNFTLFIITLALLFPIATYMLVKNHLMSVYVIPYCILPILVRVFMDSRTAFITHFIVLLTCAVSLNHPYEFILTQSVAGLVATYSLRQLSQRSELFRAAILVTCTALLTYFCLDVLNGCFNTSEGIDKWTYIYLILAGILSLLSYLFLIPIEKIFKFTSGVTLIELTNINNTVLRRLSEEAPGTFQHSLQVANLAAEVANRIGGNAQLVRAGALYHDIGKLENTVFFTENQKGASPHDGLPLEKSAQIIIQHVKTGVKLAEKYQLPSIIKDFILTHHGKGMVRYFYVTYKNKYPDQEVDESIFTYPGPNPSTMEQAILMMADAVEAASRSLQEYTEESVSNLVDNIINGQLRDGYFNRCPITFADIETAKEVFKSKLKTIYHTRIQYPQLNQSTS